MLQHQPHRAFTNLYRIPLALGCHRPILSSDQGLQHSRGGSAGRRLWKLVGKVFPENMACVRLVGRCGFREVGLHHRHSRLDGEWRDVLLVERLLGDADRVAAGER